MPKKPKYKTWPVYIGASKTPVECPVAPDQRASTCWRCMKCTRCSGAKD